MPYGDFNEVKDKLHIPPSNTAQDSIIEKYIDDADDFIDSVLQMFSGLTLPLSPVPDEIKRASQKIAKEYWWHDNSPAHPMDGVKAAKDEFEQIVRAKYGKRTDTMSGNTWGKTASGILGTEG